VVVNPVAGFSQGRRLARRVVKRLAAAGVDCAVVETTGQGDARRWAAGAGAEGFDLVLAIGGDGTVQEVVAGLVGADPQVPLAHLPVGTANVIALALSLPWTSRLAAEVILDGKILPFDVGFLPDLRRHFFLMAAIGYPARIIQDSPRRLKNLFGIFSYVAAAFRNLSRPGNARLEVLAGPAPLVVKAHTVLITNLGRIQRTGLKVSPDTSPHDGRFDISLVWTRTVWDVLKIVLRLLTWRRPTRSLRNLQASRVRIDADPPLPVQIDGEIIGTTPVLAEVVPGGVEFLVPRSYRG